MLSIPVMEVLYMTGIIIFIFVYILQRFHSWVTWMSIRIRLFAVVYSLLFIRECERVYTHLPRTINVRQSYVHYGVNIGHPPLESAYPFRWCNQNKIFMF